MFAKKNLENHVGSATAVGAAILSLATFSASAKTGRELDTSSLTLSTAVGLARDESADLVVDVALLSERLRDQGMILSSRIIETREAAASTNEVTKNFRQMTYPTIEFVGIGLQVKSEWPLHTHYLDAWGDMGRLVDYIEGVTALDKKCGGISDTREAVAAAILNESSSISIDVQRCEAGVPAVEMHLFVFVDPENSGEDNAAIIGRAEVGVLVDHGLEGILSSHLANVFEDAGLLKPNSTREFYGTMGELMGRMRMKGQLSLQQPKVNNSEIGNSEIGNKD